MDPQLAKPIRPLAKGSLRMQSDSRLLKLFRRGVDPAFDELVRRYRGALVGYAGAIAGKDRAEDVVQESLMKAHRSLSGDESIEPKPWLYTVVRNTALNDIRDNRKHSHDGLGEPAGRSMAPHELAEQKEELAAIVAAVSDLPASQRKALIGHELGGFSHEEIATELKLTTGATKQLIYRARLTLRNAIGALIPFPLIAWLVSDTAGVVATGAGGAVAGGAFGAASSGGAAGTAGGGGVMAAIAGAGGAKLAVVAVVAGGTIATGVAVEKHHASNADNGSQTAQVRPATDGSSGGQVGSILVDSSSGSSSGPGGGSGSGAAVGGGSSGKDKSGNGGDSGSNSGVGGSTSPGRDDNSGHGSSGHSPGGGTEGSGSSGKGRDGDSGGSGDDAPRPTSPPRSGGGRGGDDFHSGSSGGDDSGGGSGSGSGISGSGSGSGESGSDSGSDSGDSGSGGSGDDGYSGSGGSGSGSSGSSGTSGGGYVPPPVPKSGSGDGGHDGSGSSEDD